MASRTETQQGNVPTDGETLPPTNAKDVFIGRVLDHYRLEDRVGAGGMGLLYRATDLTLKRTVAVKLLARHLASDETAKVVFPRAKAAAVKAVELDDTLAEAHSALATVKSLYEWDWPGAEREFKRAIEFRWGGSRKPLPSSKEQ